jgi:hypothetical protein
LRRERTPVAVATRLVLILAIFYTIFYNNLPVGLSLVMISLGLATREVIERAEQAPTAVPRATTSGLARMAM